MFYLFPVHAIKRQAPLDPNKIDAGKISSLSSSLGFTTNEWINELYEEEKQGNLL